jgi:hypothetical protein
MPAFRWLVGMKYCLIERLPRPSYAVGIRGSVSLGDCAFIREKSEPALVRFGDTRCPASNRYQRVASHSTNDCFDAICGLFSRVMLHVLPSGTVERNLPSLVTTICNHAIFLVGGLDVGHQGQNCTCACHHSQQQKRSSSDPTKQRYFLSE